MSLREGGIFANASAPWCSGALSLFNLTLITFRGKETATKAPSVTAESLSKELYRKKWVEISQIPFHRDTACLREG